MKPKGYELRPHWIVAALAAGTIAGAAMTGLLFGMLSGGQYGLAVSLPLGLMAFLTALVPWGAGLVVVGAPFWVALHRSDKRDWRSAAGLGAILAGSFPGLLVGLAAAAGPPDIIVLAWAIGAPIGFAVIGALVGLVVWRVAYREVAEPSAPQEGAFQ